MGGGLTRFDPAARLSSFLSTQTPPTRRACRRDGVMCLYEDRDGDMWVGTFGGGMARIERESGDLIRYPSWR